MKSFCLVLRNIVIAFAIFHSPFAFAGTTNLVRIANFNFTPAVITITNGDSIRWSNTVALTPHDSTSSGSLWARGQLSPPKTFTFTFNNAGTFPYFCNTHRITAPQQTGTVSVVQGRVNAL